jgi:LysR family transcriptional regulator, hydrogen peroxide-inducible genes activator
MLAFSARHRLANQEEVRAIDLDNEAFLQRGRCRIGELARKVILERGASIKTTYKSDRDDWILAMVAAGMGFSCMPQQIIDHPGVIAKPLTDPELWREVSLVTVRGRQCPGPGGDHDEMVERRSPPIDVGSAAARRADIFDMRARSGREL